MPLDYHFEPGSPRVHHAVGAPVRAQPARRAALRNGWCRACSKEKAHLLLKSLPQKLRRHCVPLPDYAAGFYERWYERRPTPSWGLVDALIADMWDQVQVRPAPGDFKLETLPAHLFMNFKVVDGHGRMLAAGRNLAQLKARWANRPRRPSSNWRRAIRTWRKRWRTKT